MYRVLIVEDEKAIRFYYQMLKAWSICGFQIVGEESNGSSALERIEKEKFDLIFTDIRMPFMDGVELLKNIRERGISTPVVFASSYSDFEYAKQGIVHGLFDYLLKPVEEDKLKAVLQRVKKSLDEQSSLDIDDVMLETIKEYNLDPNNKFVKQVSIIFSSHYKEPLSLDELSEYLCLRKDYCSKLFKRNFGYNYSDFKTRVKVNYAKSLLKSRAMNTMEVSELLGFSSYNYFSKVFRSIVGISPGEYREKMQEVNND